MQGFDLIQVPCWWDGLNERYYFIALINHFYPFENLISYFSLISSIYCERPDLLRARDARPIQLNPSLSFFKSTYFRFLVSLSVCYNNRQIILIFLLN